MAFNFRGGLHIPGRKSAMMKKAIEEMDAPREVVLPLLMHKGAMCSPIVNMGDRVLLGQKIGESTDPMSAPVFASVSGTVKAIEPRLSPSGREILSVVIENDFKDEAAELPEVHDRFRTMTVDELALIAREAGIVGLGGSAYPLSEKLKAAEGKVDTLIINGAECEPYASADSRVMIENTEDVYEGAIAISKALGIKKVWIAVSSDKAGAIGELRRYLAKKPGIELVIVHTKYPQGSEKQIIESVARREVPPASDGAEAGVLVINASTSAALAKAVSEGAPLVSRVVTVAGNAVANPKNLLVRIGTPIKDLFAACGGFLEHPDKIISGGPMMGLSQASLEVPVIKGTNAVIALYGDEVPAKKETDCIHCGKCVNVCPMKLMPLYIYRAYRTEKLSECEEYNVCDCNECGCCAYVCPARISLVSAFRTVKEKLSQKAENTEDITNED